MQKSSVKEQILSQLLNAYAHTLRVFKQIAASNHPVSALFLPPTAPSSLGDKVMLLESMKHLADQGIKRLGIVNLKSSACWENLDLVTDTINLGGYFLCNSWKDCCSTKVPTLCNAAEIKSIGADLDLVFTGRMPLAIACLGQGVPVAGVTYQGKFEFFFNHFSLQGMTIAPEKAFQTGTLASFLTDIISKSDDIRQIVQTNLAKVQALSDLNF
ncbi:hypothetical protein [Synechocystis sp. PCC 7509]|uniref:hypothetical protein n=1 Tax=Synechocystis sp. PCC 7509 TaxID=927677 RepID=UPI0002ACD41B|nr:hypothetical protein [Synechocystis sp. PCC 7509]